MHLRRLGFVAGSVLLGACLRLLLAHSMGLYEAPRHVEIDNLALSVAQGRGFGSAFGDGTGPSAQYPPAYPVILGTVYYLFGSGTAGEAAKLVLNAILVSLTFALLPLLSSAWRLPRRPLVAASLFGQFLPLFFLTEMRGGEMALTALLTLVLAWRTHLLWQTTRFDGPNAALMGALWGVALLTSASLAPILAAWLVLGVVRFRDRLPAVSRFTAILVATVLVVIAPWALRNRQALGGTVALRSNLGLELQISNNSLAEVTVYENQAGDVFKTYHPFTSAEERERYTRLGELDYNALKMEEALGWIRHHPRAFASLTLKRIAYFWFPPARRPIQAGILWGVTVLAAIGLYRLWSSNRLLALQLGSALFVFPLIYYVVQFDNRYRYPIFWMFLLLASLSALPLRQHRSDT